MLRALVRYDNWYEIIPEASTGEAEGSVQGYNMRTIITRDPDNQVPIRKPENYDPDLYTEFGYGNPEKPGLAMPNEKFGLNHPKLVGEQTPYVEGDWQTRAEVTRKHVEAKLGLLYYRQHDPSVPQKIRDAWLKYGLPKDEFADNDHLPYEIYARETRRIKGRQVFTEHDAQLALQLDRAPIHSDSISITEWFLDSHACTPQRVEGSEQEGKVMMKNETFPGQVAYETLLSEEIDNLIVPVCLSSTHVGWGTIRLEPTWMSISEAAALAVVQAKQKECTPAEINIDQLVLKLAERRFLITFFNDVEGHEKSDWYPAVQYLGTQGYFGSYEAEPEKPLSIQRADIWSKRLRDQLQNKSDPETILHAAHEVLKSESIENSNELSGIEFCQKLKAVLHDLGEPQLAEEQTALLLKLNIPATEPITRGNAARILFSIIKASKK